DRAESFDSFWSMASPILAAAYHAGWLQSKSSIDDLRRLETVGIVGSSGYGFIRWAVLQTLPFRQVAKLSLLRMAQQPIWLSHYQFGSSTNATEDANDAGIAPYRFPMQVAIRDPSMLIPGKTQIDTLQRIGAPDFINAE